MDILELTNELYKLSQLNWLDYTDEEQKSLNEKYMTLKDNFEIALQTVHEPTLLERIAQKDKAEFFMPVDTIFHIYQRLIQLKPNDKTAYQDFVFYLEFYGGLDWEEEANQIKKYLSLDEMEKAFNIAISVDYDKYNK
ncbi:hypothetical protein [Ammoniphilus sp. 3BR4]|uniref:hypothetical protein n=1 Tax=Ammoniphilus sp. 3BR4 TaxID=3158265 RepID=UPI003465C899